MSEYQNYWLEMDHALQDIANGRDNSESEEKRFISKYIKALDGKSVNPKVVQDRLDDGRSVRVYLWMNTSLGNIGLVTGKEIEPTLHYLVPESENYDGEKPDVIVPQNRKEDLVSISIPLDFPNRTNGKKSPKKKTKKRRTLKRNTSSEFKIDPNKVYSYQINYDYVDGGMSAGYGEGTPFDMIKSIVKNGFMELIDQGTEVTIWLKPYATTPLLYMTYSVINDKYVLQDELGKVYLEISENLISSAIKNEADKESQSPKQDQKLDPNKEYAFQIYVLNTDDAIKEKEKGLPYTGSYLGGNTLKPKEMVEYIVNYVTNVYPLSEKQYVRVHIQLVDDGDYYPFWFVMSGYPPHHVDIFNPQTDSDIYSTGVNLQTKESEVKDTISDEMLELYTDLVDKDEFKDALLTFYANSIQYDPNWGSQQILNIEPELKTEIIEKIVASAPELQTESGSVSLLKAKVQSPRSLMFVYQYDENDDVNALYIEVTPNQTYYESVDFLLVDSQSGNKSNFSFYNDEEVERNWYEKFQERVQGFYDNKVPKKSQSTSTPPQTEEKLTFDQILSGLTFSHNEIDSLIQLCIAISDIVFAIESDSSYIQTLLVNEGTLTSGAILRFQKYLDKFIKPMGYQVQDGKFEYDVGKNALFVLYLSQIKDSDNLLKYIDFAVLVNDVAIWKPTLLDADDELDDSNKVKLYIEGGFNNPNFQEEVLNMITSYIKEVDSASQSDEEKFNIALNNFYNMTGDFTNVVPLVPPFLGVSDWTHSKIGVIDVVSMKWFDDYLYTSIKDYLTDWHEFNDKYKSVYKGKEFNYIKVVLSFENPHYYIDQRVIKLDILFFDYAHNLIGSHSDSFVVIKNSENVPDYYNDIRENLLMEGAFWLIEELDAIKEPEEKLTFDQILSILSGMYNEPFEIDSLSQLCIAISDIVAAIESDSPYAQTLLVNEGTLTSEAILRFQKYLDKFIKPMGYQVYTGIFDYEVGEVATFMLTLAQIGESINQKVIDIEISHLDTTIIRPAILSESGIQERISVPYFDTSPASVVGKKNFEFQEEVLNAITSYIKEVDKLEEGKSTKTVSDKDKFNETLREVWKANTQIEKLKPYLPSFLGSNDWHKDGNSFSMSLFNDDTLHLLEDLLKKDLQFGKNLIWEISGKDISHVDISLLFEGYNYIKDYLDISLYVGIELHGDVPITLWNQSWEFLNPMHGAGVTDYYSEIVENLIEPAQDLVIDKVYVPEPSEKAQVEVSSTEAKLPLRDFNAIMNHVYFPPSQSMKEKEIKELAPKTLSAQGEDFILYMVESFDHSNAIGIQFIYVNKEYQIEIIIKSIHQPFAVFLTDLPTNYTEHMIFKIGQNVDLSMYSSLRFDDTLKMMVGASLQHMKKLSLNQLNQQINAYWFLVYGDVMVLNPYVLSEVYGMLFEEGVSTSVSVSTPTEQEIKEEVVKNPYLMSPKMSDRQPPPPSPLKNAYYGSNAYDNGTDEEMNLSNLFSSGFDANSCKDFSGQGTHTKHSAINPYNQQCFVIKNLAITQGQAGIETLCAMLYRAMGIFVPDMRFLGSHLISPVVPERFNTNFTPSHFQELAITPKHRQKLVDLYIVSVWLANWDVTGMNNDNMLYSPSTKQFACIDVGGSLMLKANGQYKKNWEGDKIWEMDKGKPSELLQIKEVMKKELDDFLDTKYFAGKYFANLKAFNNTLPRMCLDTCERIMMLFYKDYNLVRKTLQWGDLPPAKLMTYKPFENVKSKEEMRDLLEIFLYLRAYAMYLIFEEK